MSIPACLNTEQQFTGWMTCFHGLMMKPLPLVTHTHARIYTAGAVGTAAAAAAAVLLPLLPPLLLPLLPARFAASAGKSCCPLPGLFP
jgi:hypothetical protein